MVKLSTVLAGLLFLLLCSCATLTEEERLEREDRRFEQEDRTIQAREEYYRRRDSCRRMGGTMQIRARTLGKHDYLDYKTARCR